MKRFVSKKTTRNEGIFHGVNIKSNCSEKVTPYPVKTIIGKELPIQKITDRCGRRALP
jgi:hypothetical protein